MLEFFYIKFFCCEILRYSFLFSRFNFFRHFFADFVFVKNKKTLISEVAINMTKKKNFFNMSPFYTHYISWGRGVLWTSDFILSIYGWIKYFFGNIISQFKEGFYLFYGHLIFFYLFGSMNNFTFIQVNVFYRWKKYFWKHNFVVQRRVLIISYDF